MTKANSTDWNSVSHYIDEGTEIDYRGSNASANIEYVKLAYNSDKSQMKIYFKVTVETDLSNSRLRPPAARRTPAATRPMTSPPEASP